MDPRSLTDGRLSRLTLGTVQLGLPYGIANRAGQPEYGEIRAIVAAAVEGGVNCFDTAAAYGTSEAVLGRRVVCRMCSSSQEAKATIVGPRAWTSRLLSNSRQPPNRLRISSSSLRCVLPRSSRNKTKACASWGSD